MRFQGKAAIVTGGSSGIGAAVTRALVREGAKVLAIGTTEATLASMVDELGEAVTTYVANIAQQTEIEAAVQAAAKAFGRLDLMVNNAGASSVARAGDLDPAVWRHQMAVNLDAVFWASRLALPHLIKSGGSIVTIASISGQAADYGFTAYNVAKAGVIALTRCMAIDYATDGVRVNCVSPGFITTPANDRAPQSIQNAFVGANPMKRSGRPEEIADAVLFLASPAASFINGHDLVVDGGITAHTGQPNIPALFAQLAQKGG
jgi:meso-butanediol dehydrogenase/(S,S)-butanediol dehydrogenase/diacetyl reductase